MEASEIELDLKKPAQRLQSSAEMCSKNGDESREVYHQQQLSTSISTSSAVSSLLPSLSETELHISPNDLAQPVSSEATVVTYGQNIDTSMAPNPSHTLQSVLQQTYVSEILNSVTSNQHLPASALPTTATDFSPVISIYSHFAPPSVSLPVSCQNSNMVPTADSPVSVHSPYSAVSNLRHMLNESPQYVNTSPHFPITSPPYTDPSQQFAVNSSQYAGSTQYYGKGEIERLQGPLSAHLPQIQSPNMMSYKLLELAQLSKKSDRVFPAEVDNRTTDFSTANLLASPTKFLSTLKAHTFAKSTDPLDLTESSQGHSFNQFSRRDNAAKLDLFHRSELDSRQTGDELQSILNHNKLHFNPSYLMQTLQSDAGTISDEDKADNIGLVSTENHMSSPSSDPCKLSPKYLPASHESERDSAFASDRSDPMDTDCICEKKDTSSEKIESDMEDLPRDYTRSEKEHRVQAKYFTCGGCSTKFRTICKLHLHLKEHDSGGSYHFDHVSQTAFPKYDTFCSYSQTDIECEIKEEIKHLKVIEVDEKIKDVPEVDKSTDHVVMTRRATRKQEVQESSKDTAKQVRLSTTTQGGHKRKQDHPKPTTPRMYVVPIDTKSKKAGKEKKSKTKTKRTGKKLKESKNNVEFDSDTNDETDTAIVEIDECIQSLETEGSYTPDGKLYNESKFETVIVVKEEPVGSEIEDSSAMSKPFKKRGRPRKTLGEFSKACNSKESSKKVLVTKTKKSKKKDDAVEGVELKLLNNSANSSTTGADISEETEIEEEIDDEHSEKPDSKRQRTKRGKLDKNQICDICGQSMPKYKYVFHVRSHTGERPFICEKCGKSFARSRFLTKHLITHQEVKPWRCDLCPSQFCQKNEYNMHMRGHAGDRPYQCNVCEMKFLSKTSLLTHQANIHMGLTKFECEVCQRRFFKRSSLTVHVATHYEATLKCSFCDRKFRDKTGLKRHERTHTGVKRFKCHICQHAFIQSTPFWTHMEKRHSMSRVKVKEMLNEIKETNRRSGIKTEINVLPVDTDQECLRKAEDASHKLNKLSKRQPSKDFSSHDTLPKFHQLHSQEQFSSEAHEHEQVVKTYPEIKVPSLHLHNNNSNHDSADEPFNQHMDSEVSPGLLRHFVLHPSALSQAAVLQGMQMEIAVSSAANLTSPLQSLSSLPSSLHQSVSVGPSPPTPLQLHGYIGINNLQQALDYTSNLPQSTSYTDISNDRVVNQPQ